MLLSPLKNCNDFFQTKPPMVIFFICLIFMMITVFSVTFYMKHNEKIVNTDAQQNWIALSDYLNDLELCVSNENRILNKNKHNRQSVEEISFVTFILMDSVKLKNATKVRIIYNLEGWRAQCLKNNEDGHFVVTVDFSAPSILNETNKICAIVRGPKQYLPEYSEPACHLGPRRYNPEIIPKSFSVSDIGTNLCINEGGDTTKIKVLFDSKINADKFAVFLDQNDKNVIYIHLMWCGYILLFFILMVLLYAMLYQYKDQRNYI